MPKLEEISQEDLDKIQNRLDESKAEAKKFRLERDEWKSKADNNEVNATLKARALKAEAKLAVAGLGVKDADRAVKFVSLEGVDFDEEGNVTGLTEAIEAAKVELPEVFDPKKRVAGKLETASGTPVKTEKSVTEMQVDKLFTRS